MKVVVLCLKEKQSLKKCWEKELSKCKDFFNQHLRDVFERKETIRV